MCPVSPKRRGTLLGYILQYDRVAGMTLGTVTNSVQTFYLTAGNSKTA
jgi:hypothetical protein